MDARGAFLVTGGMLLLVYTLVKAPDVGWGTGRTLAGLAVSLGCPRRFRGQRASSPVIRSCRCRSCAIKGVAVADVTQMVAVGGFFPMFFFLTLYMQTVLHYSPIQAGAAYLPLTGAFIVVGQCLFH